MLVTSWTKTMTSEPSLQNVFIWPRVGNFTNIIKIVPLFIKPTIRDSKKVKKIKNYVLKCNLYLYFLIKQKFLISCEKKLMSPVLKECVTWFTCFVDLLQLKYNCAKFHHCRICATDVREGGLFCPHFSICK